MGLEGEERHCGARAALSFPTGTRIRLHGSPIAPTFLPSAPRSPKPSGAVWVGPWPLWGLRGIWSRSTGTRPVGGWGRVGVGRGALSGFFPPERSCEFGEVWGRFPARRGRAPRAGRKEGNRIKRATRVLHEHVGLRPPGVPSRPTRSGVRSAAPLRGRSAARGAAPLRGSSAGGALRRGRGARGCAAAARGAERRVRSGGSGGEQRGSAGRGGAAQAMLTAKMPS